MRVALMLLVVASAALACGPGEPARAASSPAGARVISLHEVTTEIVLAIGARAALVGVGEPVDATAGTRAALAGIPRVDGLESVLALRPTVVLGLQTVGERSPELVAALRERGVEVWLGDPRALADVTAMVRQVARRCGTEAAGEALAVRLERNAAGAAAPGTPAAAAPVRVFVYDCCDPPFTAGGRTVLTDLVRRAGGVNVFADVDEDWTHVSWEEAAARRPEVVVVNAYAMDGQGDVDAKIATLRRIPGWKDLPVVVVPLGEALGGLRSFDGLARLRRGFTGAATRPR